MPHPTHRPPPQHRSHRPSGHGSRAEPAAHPLPVLSKIVLGKIEPTLYSDIAEEAAKSVARASKDINKPSQLRRFYDELVMLQDKIGSDQQRFQEQQPYIQMLKAKVAYAKGRGKVDESFESLLRHIVSESRDACTLKQARLFMEAFMAFYKVEGPKD